MKKNILGIRRSARFSPNSTARDEAIFAKVVRRLSVKGYQVDSVGEDDFLGADDYAGVFSMARSISALRDLAEMEREGIPVLNSPQALLNASRVAMTRRFEAEGIPVPTTPCYYRLTEKDGKRTMLAEAWKGNHIEMTFPLWLKRSGACAQSADDVCFVENEAALQSALQRYADRGIEEVIASEHLVGDLVKFYGVEGTAFFHYYYPTADNTFSKFGLEKINGAPSGYPLDAEALKQCADKAAALCGMTIYGGDGVVDATGHFRIIDFNDWPSFSCCCGEAATAIAERMVAYIDQQEVATHSER